MTGERGAWFDQARLGIFFHWGVYSAGARGEWLMNRERYTPQAYDRRYGERFSAERWDPDDWMDLVRRAGADYVVLTTRHHDGFCLWPTTTTQRHAGRMGPRRDVVGEFTAAARRAGLRVGLYYSIADWSHPDYPSAEARDWPEVWTTGEAARRRFVTYYRDQLRELLTTYGPIDYLWYDGAFPAPLEGRETNRMVYDLQPGILINERNGEPFDVSISEQTITPKEGRWEACMTLNQNWGYHVGDDDWKSPREVIANLLQIRAAGGKMLMNLGPRADGSIPEESRRILSQVGAWIAANGACLPGRERSPFSWNNSVMITPGNTTTGEHEAASTLYVHILRPLHGDFRLCEWRGDVRRITVLADGEEIAFDHDDDGWLRLIEAPAPVNGLPVTLLVEAQEPIVPLTERTQFWIPE